MRVFCDIPQESNHVVGYKIPYDETRPGFVCKMNHNSSSATLSRSATPAIAETLFIDHDTIWPPEGVLPLHNEDDSIVFPEQYANRTDIVYEKGPGRGWRGLVYLKEDPEALMNVKPHWKAIE